MLYAWGLPLGQLALTAAYWASRALGSGALGSVFPCLAAFASSGVVYWSLLYSKLNSAEGASQPKSSKPYEAAAARLKYSYFNTNPAYVLMSEHMPQMGLPRTTWYEAGRVHLQTTDVESQARVEALRAAAERAPAHTLQPWSLPSRLLYQALVWFSGAPSSAYESFEEAHNSPVQSRRDVGI